MKAGVIKIWLFLLALCFLKLALCFLNYCSFCDSLIAELLNILKDCRQSGMKLLGLWCGRENWSHHSQSQRAALAACAWPVLHNPLSATYSGYFSIKENQPLDLVSLVSFCVTLQLILSDWWAIHFLMFLGPKTVKQCEMANQHSDITSPNGMPCPGTYIIREGDY